eukprot:scaffold206908_cov13-Tisochrysis_lutea.AAC.1
MEGAACPSSRLALRMLPSPFHAIVHSLCHLSVQYDRNCSEFSGGWQMRIALAKLLLGPAGQAAVGAGTGGLML